MSFVKAIKLKTGIEIIGFHYNNSQEGIFHVSKDKFTSLTVNPIDYYPRYKDGYVMRTYGDTADLAEQVINGLQISHQEEVLIGNNKATYIILKNG